MALKLNGRDDRLRRADFRALAGTAGVRASDADAAIDETLQRMKDAAGRISLPDLADYAAESDTKGENMMAIVLSRLDSFV